VIYKFVPIFWEIKLFEKILPRKRLMKMYRNQPAVTAGELIFAKNTDKDEDVGSRNGNAAMT